MYLLYYYEEECTIIINIYCSYTHTFKWKKSRFPLNPTHTIRRQLTRLLLVSRCSFHVLYYSGIRGHRNYMYDTMVTYGFWLMVKRPLCHILYTIVVTNNNKNSYIS